MDEHRDHGDETDFDFDSPLTQASEEIVAHLRAVVDIGVENMREHARIIGCYYGQLVGIGVPEQAALTLAVNFQTIYISALFGG